MQASYSSEASVLTFELKYCERCGGLWLRPGGGGEIYCGPCGPAVAELPAVLREPKREANLMEDMQWQGVGGKLEGYDEDEETDLYAPGGAA
jgi:Zn-finger nucleic acid-binding protein